MSAPSSRKRKTCRHKLFERGTINLELRWFHQISKKEGRVDLPVVDDNGCLECLNEARGRDKADRLYSFYKELQVTQVTVPRPATYEELQQHIALLVPASCGIAAVERPDGTVASPPFQHGEVIIFREIRPLHQTEDSDQRSGVEGCYWEQEAYRDLLRKL